MPTCSCDAQPSPAPPLEAGLKDDAELAAFLKRPLTVRGRSIPGRLFLAPLSKLGNTAFRELVAGYGGYGLLFSEMCWARSVPCGNGHDQGGFMWRAGENLQELVCQIFGNDPGAMAQAAAIIEAEGFFGIDLNFGCSVAAVCRKGCGAALLRAPERAAAIVAAVRRTVDIPVFVKYRTGWEDRPDTPVALARRFEDAGADALTFHPRVAPDRRTRPPKWTYIAEVKSAVAIPVIGNGDVFDRTDCARMLRTTGCDGVALGRLALAKPWIFGAWTGRFDPAPEIYRTCALEMTQLLERYYQPATALRRFRKFAAYFSANFLYGHTLYARLSRAQDMTAIRETLVRFFEAPPEVAARPNMNRFR
jgi:nifR3 family TIM-barrel protein